MPQLTEQFRITEANLALRRTFIRIGNDDKRILAKLAPWARKVAPAIAREFYDFQFAFPPTRRFFDKYAAMKGLGIGTLRDALERAQAGYFIQIFEESEQGGEYGTAYFEKRLHVGSVHNIIDLPMKWYIGSYSLYTELARKHLRRSFRFRARFRAAAEASIAKIMNLDTQAVADAFFLQLLSSLGFDLSSVELEDPSMDISESFRMFKKAAGDALRGMIVASEELTGVGQQIAAASQHVSTNVQHQAASLEETAASLGTITASVKQNAADARRANDLASSASTESGSKVQSVAVQMKEISASSRQIESIITLINEIAFQTNLLALNAAVEAARAGEHGRGFAVVASEVGNLAKRSASAAKEISTLIKDSAQKVDAGAKSVAAVTELIKNISSSTVEQSKQIDQVSAVVSQMDQGTQSNAAQAEQLNATAEQLASRASELRDLMRYFKLDVGSGFGG